MAAARPLHPAVAVAGQGLVLRVEVAAEAGPHPYPASAVVAAVHQPRMEGEVGVVVVAWTSLVMAVVAGHPYHPASVVVVAAAAVAAVQHVRSPCQASAAVAVVGAHRLHLAVEEAVAHRSLQTWAWAAGAGAQRRSDPQGAAEAAEAQHGGG